MALVNDIKPGKSWLVSWELGEPAQTDTKILKTDATFSCGETIYNVFFNLFRCTSNNWYLQLDFETTKGNDKLNEQELVKIQLL